MREAPPAVGLWSLPDLVPSLPRLEKICHSLTMTLSYGPHWRNVKLCRAKADTRTPPCWDGFHIPPPSRWGEEYRTYLCEPVCYTGVIYEMIDLPDIYIYVSHRKHRISIPPFCVEFNREDLGATLFLNTLSICSQSELDWQFIQFNIYCLLCSEVATANCHSRFSVWHSKTIQPWSIGLSNIWLICITLFAYKSTRHKWSVHQVKQ